MPTRNVVLTGQQADLVGALVCSGRYQNASEVPRDGLRQRQGEQCAVPTPGKNRKHYVDRALHAHSERLVWVEHERKTTPLLRNFCRLALVF